MFLFLGSPFSLRIGKDVREVRQGAKDIFRADRKVSRYKTHDEQRAERRNYYSEREIPVSAPQAPPRSKKKRQRYVLTIYLNFIDVHLFCDHFVN